jgi:hypothetical protein
MLPLCLFVSQYLGIYFGGQWCPYCIDFAPVLDEFYRRCVCG